MFFEGYLFDIIIFYVFSKFIFYYIFFSYIHKINIFFRNYPNALIFLPSLRAPVLLFSITREGSVEFQIET